LRLPCRSESSLMDWATGWVMALIEPIPTFVQLI
jgi:hypothetical protein